jgi:hypothetical protein
MNGDPRITKIINDPFEEWREELEQSMDSSYFSDEERSAVGVIANRSFVTEIERFFAEYAKVKDTPENRRIKLEQFADKLGFDLDLFLEYSDFYIGFAELLENDDESSTLFFIFKNIAKIVKFSKGEEM